MQPTQELVDAIFREKVLRARRTPPFEKLFAGPRLFDAECERIKADIRAAIPDVDEATRHWLFLTHMEHLRQLEEP